MRRTFSLTKWLREGRHLPSLSRARPYSYPLKSLSVAAGSSQSGPSFHPAFPFHVSGLPRLSCWTTAPAALCQLTPVALSLNLQVPTPHLP